MSDECCARTRYECEKEFNEGYELLKKQNAKLVEALKSLSGVFRYYDDHYANANWDVGADGRVCDPEHYIYQDLKKAQAVLKELGIEE